MEMLHLLLTAAACLLMVTVWPAVAQREPNELQMSNSGYRLEHDP